MATKIKSDAEVSKHLLMVEKFLFLSLFFLFLIDAFKHSNHFSSDFIL